MDDYFVNGEKQAYLLPNRGPLKFGSDGQLHQDILDAYWNYGFYVLENVVDQDEIDKLIIDFEKVLVRAPINKGAKVDARGEPSIDQIFKTTYFQFAKPLSDPMGATGATGGRYPIKMTEYEAPSNAPEQIILQINGNLQIMDAHLHLYGNPGLLKAAEAINGHDFVPFTDAVWVKPAYYGAAVAWHQDGVTHWESSDLNAGTHGFNFMAQLYPTNPLNALWIIPQTHDKGRVDLKKLIEENGGSDQLPGAVPLLCKAGDVAICNRQMVHCSFPNRSPDPRVTYVFGFHRRASIEGVDSDFFGTGETTPFDKERIYKRSRIIQLAIDARHQNFPDEVPYNYLPMELEIDRLRFSPKTRETILKNYNQYDLFI